MKVIANRLITLLYPERCVLCDDLLAYGSKTRICADCKGVLPSYAPVNRDILPTVYSALDAVYPVFRYEGAIRDAVIRLKFHGMKSNAAAMADLIKQADWLDSFISVAQSSDLFIPVPLHKSRLKDRGFNQAELLARALSGLYGVSVSTALTRVKKTKSMFGLSRTQRFDNIRGAFALSDSASVNGKSIIMVDDIYTTGATVEECARILKEAGAVRVCTLAFAVADGHTV